MNGKDKISVIIPCYNVQKYIMRCFDSIYSQTYGFENLEVILIDDLSTDNTWSILESLQRQYPENVISLKIQKKGKCGGARNLGMDICTGKYITFVGIFVSGDCCVPFFLDAINSERLLVSSLPQPLKSSAHVSPSTAIILGNFISSSPF